MRVRWLPRFPNYDRAYEVEVVQADLSEPDFMERFVLRHRPCVVRGGAKHWPAVKKWDVELLRSAAGDLAIGKDYALRLEPIPLYSLDRILDFVAPLNGPLTLAGFLDQVVSNDYPYVQLN